MGGVPQEDDCLQPEGVWVVECVGGGRGQRGGAEKAEELEHDSDRAPLHGAVPGKDEEAWRGGKGKVSV